MVSCARQLRTWPTVRSHLADFTDRERTLQCFACKVFIAEHISDLLRAADAVRRAHVDTEAEGSLERAYEIHFRFSKNGFLEWDLTLPGGVPPPDHVPRPWCLQSETNLHVLMASLSFMHGTSICWFAFSQAAVFEFCGHVGVLIDNPYLRTCKIFYFTLRDALNFGKQVATFVAAALCGICCLPSELATAAGSPGTLRSADLVPLVPKLTWSTFSLWKLLSVSYYTWNHYVHNQKHHILHQKIHQTPIIAHQKNPQRATRNSKSSEFVPDGTVACLCGPVTSPTICTRNSTIRHKFAPRKQHQTRRLQSYA